MMKKGFSLVELSIVLVIIGLLAGGILVGQNIINASRNSEVIKALQQYEIAVTNFYSIYRYYPGDLPNTSAFAGSTQASGNFANSDETRGDGFVGSYTNGDWEVFFSFPDLAAAEIISDNYPYPSSATVTTGPDSTNIAAAATWPFPKLSGGTIISIVSGGTNLTDWGSISTSLEHCAVTVTAGAVAPVSSYPKQDILRGNISPGDAKAIDSKMDDGNPSTGIIIGDNGQISPGYTGNTGCLMGDARLADGPFDGSLSYDLNNSDKSCIINKCIDSSKFALE